MLRTLVKIIKFGPNLARVLAQFQVWTKLGPNLVLETLTNLVVEVMPSIDKVWVKVTKSTTKISKVSRTKFRPSLGQTSTCPKTCAKFCPKFFVFTRKFIKMRWVFLLRFDLYKFQITWLTKPNIEKEGLELCRNFFLKILIIRRIECDWIIFKK